MMAMTVRKRRRTGRRRRRVGRRPARSRGKRSTESGRYAVTAAGIPVPELPGHKELPERPVGFSHVRAPHPGRKDRRTVVAEVQQIASAYSEHRKRQYAGNTAARGVLCGKAGTWGQQQVVQRMCSWQQSTPRLARHARTSVGHPDLNPIGLCARASVRLCADRDPHTSGAAAECVADQIHEGQAKLCFVGSHQGQALRNLQTDNMGWAVTGC